MSDDSKRPILVLLTSHWVSLLGVALVTTAGFSWLFVLPTELRGHTSNPYIGIVVFLLIPIIFVLGLVLMALGMLLARRRISSAEHELWAAGDRRAYIRKLAIFFAVTTAANIVIGTQGTYRAVDYMETPQFCGQSCHVMKPEFTAHQNSPHARVDCVECHVAPGATGWVKSKEAGTRQLIDTVFKRVHYPIESAMESNRLIPARETCETCHWPQVFDAVKLRVIFHFKDDAANTQTQTVLMMLTGGGTLGGIHGKHMGPGVEIHYAAADAKRQTIPWVEYRNRNTGETTTFLADGSNAQSIASLPRHQMECVDCHNRPTHTFELPERAVDEAMGLGQISTTLPFIKKKAVELLKANYSSSEEASRAIPDGLARYYQQNYAAVASQRSQDIANAGTQIAAIYNRNVFPELKVTWGTYPNNLGHMDFPGCFRCHDGSHTTGDGKNTITQDCTTCHTPLAMDEASPQILKTLNLSDQISEIQKK
ncbi:MAG TPA: NapC/NirT family cytochrome c [Candidatus Sulfotelmatobacter sp.]|nr:NapC/NirT family cytochrome c [Candidatus Sulfotelmatobacter sp.]